MEIKTSQYVQGYYRNKNEVLTAEPSPDNGSTTFYSVIGFLALPAIITINPKAFLELAILLLVSVGVGIGIHAYRQHRAELEARPKLIINNAGKTSTIYL